MANKKKSFWIQGAHANKGALHKQLGYPESKKIPVGVLERIVETPIGDHVRVNGESRKVTHLLKSRANFARNVRVR